MESRFEERVRVAIRYASTIDDFNELADLWTLARHCLGPKPSHYVLRAIRQEEKSESSQDESGSSFLPFLFSFFFFPLLFFSF